MLNIKGLPINFDPDLTYQLWDHLLPKYSSLENTIEYGPNEFYLKHVHNSGAFFIPIDNEVNISEDLKHILTPEITNNYSIKTSEGYILRGLNYFPGMIKGSIEDKLKLIDRELRFFINLLYTEEIRDLIIYLAVLDYIKNYLLLLKNSLGLINYDLQIDITPRWKSRISIFEAFLKNVSDSFWDTYETQNISNLDDSLIIEFLDIYKTIYSHIFNNYKVLRNMSNFETKFIRRHRESNDPLKLSVFGNKMSHKYLPKDTVIIGLEYGGIELPYLVNSYRRIRGKSTLKYLTINLSSYSSKNMDYVSDITDIPTLNVSETHVMKNTKTVLILDDSSITGRTLEKLVGLLPSNIQNIFLGLSSVKITNRFHHVIREGHGGINPLILESACIGSLAEFSNTYTINKYTDEKGIFDKSKYNLYQLMSTTYEIDTF